MITNNGTLYNYNLGIITNTGTFNNPTNLYNGTSTCGSGTINGIVDYSFGCPT